jgi:hypothetical protein
MSGRCVATTLSPAERDCSGMFVLAFPCESSVGAGLRVFALLISAHYGTAGNMATRKILDLCVMVRIHARQLLHNQPLTLIPLERKKV